MFFEDCSASNLNCGSIYGYTRNVQCVYFCTQHNKMSLLKNLYNTKFVTAKKSWRHTGGMKVQLHSLLISASVGSYLSTSRPDCFIPRKEPRYPLYTSLGEPKSLFGSFRSRDGPACRLVAIPTEQHATACSSCYCSKTSLRDFRMASFSKMALGSTQPVTEMSTRNIFWGVKATGA
jgi:hypothetical protein